MRAHDEAVEQRDVAARAGAGEDAAGRQEAEIGHSLVEARAHFSRAFLPPFSAAAAARATRQNVSSRLNLVVFATRYTGTVAAASIGLVVRHDLLLVVSFG